MTGIFSLIFLVYIGAFLFGIFRLFLGNTKPGNRSSESYRSKTKVSGNRNPSSDHDRNGITRAKSSKNIPDKQNELEHLQQEIRKRNAQFKEQQNRSNTGQTRANRKNRKKPPAEPLVSESMQHDELELTPDIEASDLTQNSGIEPLLKANPDKPSAPFRINKTSKKKTRQQKELLKAVVYKELLDKPLSKRHYK